MGTARGRKGLLARPWGRDRPGSSSAGRVARRPRPGRVDRAHVQLPLFGGRSEESRRPAAIAQHPSGRQRLPRGRSRRTGGVGGPVNGWPHGDLSRRGRRAHVWDSCFMPIRCILREDPRSFGPTIYQPLPLRCCSFKEPGTRSVGWSCSIAMCDRCRAPTVELLEADHSLGGAKNAPRMIERTVEWIGKLVS